MKNLNKKKKIITCSVLLFSFLSITIFANFNFEPPFYKDGANKDDFINFPKTSDSLPSSKGMGNKVNITLHQSYLNTSTIEFTNLDSENNFLEPFPNFNGYNTSFINMTVDSINAPNYTLVVEDDTITNFDDFTNSNPDVTSFEVIGNGYLENISVYVRNVAGNPATVTMVLYNSTWDTGNSRSEPDGTNLGYVSTLGTFNVPATTTGTYSLFHVHYLLNNTFTENNTWFIGLFDGGVGADTRWYYVADQSNGDNDDESTAYYYSSGWVLRDDFLLGDPSVDFRLSIDLSPINNIPKPSEINLKLNTTLFYDISQGSGYYSSEEAYSSTSDVLNFTVSADWWDVSCNITKVQINYTKTDLRADSSFEVLGNGQDVFWNVTKSGGLNYFDSRFNNYTINFTISSRWTNIEVWNGGTDKTGDIKTHNFNHYKDIQMVNAGNGTYWFLNATSSNLLTDIKKYVGTTSVADTFNYTDLVHFNGTFSSSISDGSINLSVYNPLALDDRLNYTLINNSFVSGDDIYFGNWDISDTVTKYGKFRILTQWNNGTDAGFFRDNITILAETSLLINQPSQNTIFNSSKIFNITITYDDIGQVLDISDGDIYYKINAGTYSSVNASVKYIGNSQYNITFDCNNTEFNYGSNTITIRANNTYYHNQTKTLEIIILGETELDGSILKVSFDSMETFNVSMFYNDTVKDSGILGAIRDVYVNSTPYTPISNHDYGDGNYNITINCDDDIFQSQGYGYFNLSINVEKSYYYNQSTEFIIYITGETSLSTTKFPDPSIGYYNSDELFNITAYFEDIGRSEGINGGLAKIFVKEISASSYQEYTPVIIDPLGGGYYNITVDCSDPIFNPYGKYNIKINITKSHYYTAEEILGEIVVGNTTLTILDPTGSVFYVEDETFDIMIGYEDHTLASGIAGADITYTIDGSNYRWDNVLDNIDGTYNITIDVGDADFGTNYGNVDIIIRANKTNYINLTRTLTFERQITTQITPFNNPPLVEIEKGLNVTYTFNYSDTSGNPIVEYDIFQPTSPLFGFQYYLRNDVGDGNYTLFLNSSNVGVIVDPFTLNFSISVFGNQSQEISLTILVTIIQTSIEIQSWNNNADFARSTWINASIDFYFNDTTNIDAIDGLIDSDIIIKDYYAGTTWQPGFELFIQPGPGNYKLNISTVGKNSGLYTLQLNISKSPNYNWSLAYIQFYLRGNYTQINLISLEDPGGELTPSGLGYNFTIFEESDLDIEFNITDLEFSNNSVLGDVNSYYITYINLGTGSNGTLLYDINFITNRHIGTISTSNINLVAGSYLINITVSKTNYENTSFIFNLTVIEKYQTRLTVVLQPTEVNAGEVFSIVLLAEFYNGSEWLILQGSNVIMTPYFNGIASTEIQTKSTNSTGGVSFDITIRSDARTMNITLELQVEYNHLADTLYISDISVIPLTPGLTFEELLPYIIIIGAAIALAGGSLAVYRGVVVPKKREKQRILTEVKTIFDDAINLEHILVLYKGTGTCIFFKSYGSEQIDPELIGGFLTAVSSFGKEMATQESLNEISYGDKMLLLADGQFIRVALVLGKKASLILRRHLKEFIDSYEKTYKEVLPNWRGQLNHFRNAGIIVDEILNTSIILPHQISYDISSVKEIKSSFAKDVLKVAHSCCKEADRDFFFIATLLKEASEKSNKDTAEIFMGIKELRDKKILIPIEISTIEAQPISQQELNLISQKVASLTTLTNDERQKLVNDLGQLGPIEREAYLSSLAKQHQIVSAPIKSTIGTTVVDNKKSAEKGVKELTKRAKIAKGKKNYPKTIELYQNAAMLASNWELSNEFVQIEEIIRKTKIEDLSTKKKDLEKEAKDAVKSKNYAEASTKYKYASKIASEIFKLGASDMTREVKRLTKKANEYEKLK